MYENTMKFFEEHKNFIQSQFGKTVELSPRAGEDPDDDEDNTKPEGPEPDEDLSPVEARTENHLDNFPNLRK